MSIRRRVAVGCALVAIMLALGLGVTLIGTPPVDPSLVADASELRDGTAGSVFRFASDVGFAKWLLPLATVVAAMLWFVGRRTEAVTLELTMLVVLCCNWLFKQLFARLRPDHGMHEALGGFSMPSGHSSSSAAFAAAIVLALHWAPRRRRIALAVLGVFALVVGCSRVVLGVHFPTDVLAGWSYGVGTALLLDALRRRWGAVPEAAG